MHASNETLAHKLREAGNDLPAVAALYADALARQDRSGVQVHADVAYGADERHRLDIYRPQGQPPAGGWPVVLFLHGGGFIRGDKGHRANLGYWLAQQGYVAVLANYRLAPQHVWPSGPQDVVAAWQWLQQHGGQWGMDGRRVVLMGESAGAAHVAAAALVQRLQCADWHIAGAVLLSGPYNARLEGLARSQFGIAAPDPRNEAYMGSDPQGWDAASIVDQVSAPPFPLWISWTEWDLLQMQVQAAELFARLVSRHGYQPRLHVLAQHNHFSQGYSFGTDDDTLSAPLLDFLRTATSI